MFSVTLYKLLSTGLYNHVPYFLFGYYLFKVSKYWRILPKQRHRPLLALVIVSSVGNKKMRSETEFYPMTPVVTGRSGIFR